MTSGGWDTAKMSNPTVPRAAPPHRMSALNAGSTKAENPELGFPFLS